MRDSIQKSKKTKWTSATKILAVATSVSAFAVGDYFFGGQTGSVRRKIKTIYGIGVSHL